MRPTAPTRQPAGRRRTAPALTTLALLVAGLGAAQAQTWTGAGFSNAWSDALNWQGLNRPVSSASTAITFAGAARLQPVQNLALPFTLNALTFASGAGNFQLVGNGLRFDGSNARLLQNSTGSTVTIASEVQLATSLVIDGPGNLALTGNLARAAGADRGPLALTKRGSGALVLTSANSYDAGLRIDGGVVRARHAQALQSAIVQLNVDNGLDFGPLAQATLGALTGSGALALGATELVLDSTDTTIGYSGNVTGTSGVTKNGGNTARWSGTSQVDRLQVNGGRMVFNGGALTLRNADQGLMVGTGTAGTPAPDMTVTNGATVSATGHTVQVDGGTLTQLNIDGAGSQLNTGFQTLVGNHASGRLQVGSGGTLAAGTFLLVGWDNGGQGTLAVHAGGTVTGSAGVIGGLTGSNGQADVNGNAALWSTNSLGIGGFSDGQRGGTGVLTVRDGAEVRVRDTLGFWSTTATATVDGGTLRAGALSGAAGLGSITLQADPTGGAALVLDGDADASFAGTVSGAGSLLKTGAGAQTLAGASPGFSGVTTIRGGRIVIGHQDALRGSQVRIDVANGLDVNGLANVVVGSLAGSGALALGNTQFTLGEDNQASSYSGVFSGSGATLVKKGSGTLTLDAAGSALNRLVVEGGGAVALDGGSLALNSPSNGAVALALNAGGRLAVRAGAQLAVDGGGQSSIFLSGDAATELLVEGAGSRLTGGFQTVVGNAGLGRLTLRDGALFEGRFGLVVGFGNGSNGKVSVESGAQGTAPVVVAGTLAGSSGLVQVAGAGTRLAATSLLGLGGYSDSQNGGTGALAVSDGGLVEAEQLRFWTAGSSARIDGGTLRAGRLDSSAGGSITLAADPAGGRALVLTSHTADGSYNGSIDGDGSLLKAGGATQVLSGRNSFTGLVQVQGGVLEMASSGASEYEVGPFATLRLGERNLGGAVVQAAVAGRVVYTNTSLSGGVLVGPGSHDISAVRRLSGTRVTGGVFLAPTSGTTFVALVNDGRIDNLNGRSLTWTGGSNPNGRVLVAGTTTVSSFSSGGQLQVGATGTLLSTSGDLVLGGGSRTTVGAANGPGGTVELLAGGRVQVNGGLLVNNGRILAPVDVNFGSLAKGAGTYGAVFVNDGGRFSPGNSPGTVTTGDADWGAGGTLLVELAAASGTAGVDWDLWTVNGALALQSGTTANSRFTISLQTLDRNDLAAPLAGFDPHRAWQWQIVDTSGGILGFDPARLALDAQGFASPLAGGTLRLAVQDGDLYLQFAPVPEPQTAALLLGGLGVLGWAARRRRMG